ncbi:hypothetical protein PVK06_027800 [Gossypium arboreum]|uniref:Uncharacterized protein n=1 Tax=Gossypium arboreum TaxID=29729 RepID=A0ABR0P192_GOSAR|nr:hypothetical protein PVK06_027800 [Gossypium arboreum]
MRKIDSLVADDFIVSQEAPSGEEEVHVAVVNEKSKEENTEIEAAEKRSAKNIVNASKIVDATTDNLKRDGAKPSKVTEVINEEHHNSLAIIVYTRPLKVTPPTQEAVDDTGTTSETKEQSEDRVKHKEKKRKCSKDKKHKKEVKKMRKKKHCTATLMAEENRVSLF